VKFGELRDKRLGELTTVLTNSATVDVDTDWLEVRSFLGYAPVLGVITEYLCPSNFNIELQRDFVQARGPRDVLLGIVTSLLDREQNKFRDNVLPVLRAKLSAAEEWPEYGQSYAIDEQIARILDRLDGQGRVIDLPASIPSSIRAEYQDRARSFAADHPFVSGRRTVNAVFNDYILARQVRAIAVQAALGAARYPEPSEVGPFFFQFLAALDGDHPRPVPEALLPAIIASHSQTVTQHEDMMSLIQTDGQATLVLLGGMAENGTDFVGFELEELSGYSSFLST